MAGSAPKLTTSDAVLPLVLCLLLMGASIRLGQSGRWEDGVFMITIAACSALVLAVRACLVRRRSPSFDSLLTLGMSASFSMGAVGLSIAAMEAGDVAHPLQLLDACLGVGGTSAALWAWRTRDPLRTLCAGSSQALACVGVLVSVTTLLTAGLFDPEIAWRAGLLMLTGSCALVGLGQQGALPGGRPLWHLVEKTR